MSTPNITIANAAAAAFGSIVLGVLLSAANADPTTRSGLPAVQDKDRVSTQAACVIVERPKHTIRTCRCDPDALSDVASIDVAEMIRLLIGSPSCHPQVSPRT